MSNIAALTGKRVASICTFVSHIKTIWKSKGKNNYGVDLMPGVTADQEGFQMFGGMANSISSLASDKEKEAGWLFIEYCVSPEQEIKWGTNTAFTVRRLSTGDLPEMIKYWEENPQYYPAYKLIVVSAPHQYPLNLNQFSADRNSIVDMIIYEDMTPEKAEALLQESAELYLNDPRPATVYPTSQA